ncbi:uncharacterized protein LOC141639690 [Silene latifolia]|uniref:uncharacterized protein LOC141639690 n=1 Tax=Silene latifolia TaxID=37657 RepID=UPI003D76EA61
MDDHGKRSSSSTTSYGQNGMQLDLYRGANNNNNRSYDLRSYSLNSSYYPHQNHNNSNIYDNNNNQIAYEFDYKLKRSKTTSPNMWCFSDPEFKRKKRVASYRALTVEGKVKGSLRKSFKWVKDRLLHGWMVVTN